MEAPRPISTDQPASSDAAHDREFWSALRRVLGKLIDALEESARTDAQFRSDVMRVLGSGASAAITVGDVDAGDRHPPSSGNAGADSGPDGDGSAPLAEDVEQPAPGGAAAPASALHVSAASPPLLPSLTPRLVAPAAPPAAPVYPPQWTREPFNPDKVAAACRMKAEACRWQSERSRRLDLGEDVSAGDRQLLARAGAMDVWLWMVSPNKWRERTEDAFAVVGGCYDALAEAAELMGLADETGVEQQAALRLLGEAQSALRVALEDYASTRRDDDQERAFLWLRRETDVRQVYVEYMQLNHPAPPGSHAELRHRIAAVRALIDAHRRKAHDVDAAFKKLQWHARAMANRHPDAGRMPATDPDLATVSACAAQLLEGARVAPSDTRLREALLPLLDRLPDDLEEPAFRPLLRILSAVQEYLDERAADDEVVEERAATPPDDPALQRARQLVQGLNAVLIGGQPSELHRGRLESGLGLRALDWVRVEHHGSFEPAEMAIRRPNIGLVLLMTRWRSHRDGPAARQICKSLGIPLVELPAGYNVRQVAHRIVEQLSAAAG